MSATDFRRIIDLPNNEYVTIECSDGRTVSVEHSELGVISGFDLNVDELRALHLSLGDALDLVEAHTT